MRISQYRQSFKGFPGFPPTHKNCHRARTCKFATKQIQLQPLFINRTKSLQRKNLELIFLLFCENASNNFSFPTRITRHMSHPRTRPACQTYSKLFRRIFLRALCKIDISQRSTAWRPTSTCNQHNRKKQRRRVQHIRE